jgi:hypothetical protein
MLSTLDRGAKEWRMAKYFFNFQRANGPVALVDEGEDLPSLEEARATALVSARELLAKDVKFANSNLLTAVIVTEAAGGELFEFPRPIFWRSLMSDIPHSVINCWLMSGKGLTVLTLSGIRQGTDS